MKKILIPIDFSKASENAFQYALNFVKHFNGTIDCIHAYDKGESEEYILTKTDMFKANNISLLEEVEVQFFAFKNSLNDAVKEYLSKNKVDLILMGTKGVKGFNKFIGVSHTTDLLSHFKTPFLIIPESYKFKHLNYIMWASDFKFIDNDDAIDILVEIVKEFEAEVRIAHVKTSKKHGSHAEHLERSREKYLFEAENIKYSFKRIHKSDISEGIQYYLSLKGDNDMLCLIRREHGFMSKLFRKDHAMEFASHPEIPLLILHE